MNNSKSQGADRRRERPIAPFRGYRWAEYLVAILGGNIVYLFIEPQLPLIFRHRLFRVDLGLAVDFVICAIAYALVRQVRGPRDDRG